MKKAINYSNLTHSDFDAIVTGELVHINIFLELQINNFISAYFTHRGSRKGDFRSIILHSACLTFQNKIDITRAVLNKYYPHVNKSEAASILNRIEAFKTLRNSFSHGFASNKGMSKQVEVSIEMTSRSGKLKIITITPDNHKEKLKDYVKLMYDVANWRIDIIKIINKLKK